MRVLVTGGAGYIGSVCVERLLELGHNVLAADDLSSGRAQAVLPPARLEIVRRDDPQCWTKVVEGFRPDTVMHFAATALIDCSMYDPGPVFVNNVSNTLALLEAMRAAGARDLVFSSTAAVYGEPKFVPITESHPLSPINAYGESKLAIERMLVWYRRAYQLRSVMFRYFNAAGATARCGEMRDKETHLIPIVLDAALGIRQGFRIHGNDYPTPDGTCIRDYVHVQDIVEAHVLAISAMEAIDGQAFNIGSGKGFSVMEIHREACAVTGRQIPLTVGCRRAGDPAVLVADASKLSQALGWKAEHSSLGEILQSAWRWRVGMRDRGVGRQQTRH